MKKYSLILTMLLGSICFGQSHPDLEILEVYTSTPIGLVSLIDAHNPNVLAQTSHLDSSASHHVKYLFKDFLQKYPVIDISHEESIDFPNFQEKLHPEDRTGGRGQTREICNIYNRTKLINRRKSDRGFLVKTGHFGSYKTIFFPDFKEEDLDFGYYRNSHSHWETIKDPDLNFIGSSSIVCVYRTTRGLTGEQILGNKVKIGLVSINVTVFMKHLEKPKDEENTTLIVVNKLPRK